MPKDYGPRSLTVTVTHNCRYLISSFIVTWENNLGHTDFLDFKEKYHHCFHYGEKLNLKIKMLKARVDFSLKRKKGEEHSVESDEAF